MHRAQEKRNTLVFGTTIARYE